MDSLKGKHAEIFEDRERRYGNHVLGHQNLGLIWTALIQHHYGIKLPYNLPAHLVELMMMGNKINRIAVNPAGHDHYDDAQIYLAMAEDAAEREGVFQKENGEDKV